MKKFRAYWAQGMSAIFGSESNLFQFLSKNIRMYRTIIWPVLYGCGTWSVTLREERRLRVFENRVLRRIFRSKRNEVTGEWRWLHDEEHYDLYSLSNIIRVIESTRVRWAGHVTRLGKRGGASEDMLPSQHWLWSVEIVLLKLSGI
jgi:hypothetical protein